VSTGKDEAMDTRVLYNAGLIRALNVGVLGFALFLMMMSPVSADLCADFDDIPAATEFHVGDTGFSWGYELNFKEFFWPWGGSTVDGEAFIDTNWMAGGSGFDMAVNNINVDVKIAGDTAPTCVSFRYGDYAGNVNLEINGSLKVVEDFIELDGEEVEGVTVEVIPLGGSKGVVELHGAVTQLAIGGQQFFLDDICPFCEPPEKLCADFDDLVLETNYYVDDTCTTQGYLVKFKKFFWSSGTGTVDGNAQVMAAGMAGGSGFEMGLFNINADIDIAGGTPVPCVTFRFGEYGGNINLEINGDLRNAPNLSDLDGAVVGGVTVDVISLGGGKGLVELQGPVSQLAVGGQEFALDDVCPRCISPAEGCADFDDLAPGTEYHVGNTFLTQGYLATCHEFFWLGGGSTVNGTATVATGGDAGGSGFDLSLNNINVDIAINAPCVSFRYGEYGGNLNIKINGDFKNFANFADIDGAVIGGVPVDVLFLGDGKGIVELQGPVTQLALGGQEFFIDDICPFCEPDEGEGEMCADFEDLTAETEYHVGDMFATQGYLFKGQEFFWLPSGSTINGVATVMSGGWGSAGGSGNDLSLNNINVDIAINAPCVSFRFGAYGGNLNIEVNGELKNIVDFADIDGTTIGGVPVEVIFLGDGKGIVELQGPVTQLALGGQEFFIDDICPFCKPDEGEGEPLTYHPADPNGDFRIVMSEAIAYLAGWQQGSNPMAYAIRAAYIWQNGEKYLYDDTLDPPLCWAPIVKSR